MADKPRARFTMENFGPIRSGSFDLRPLTVFIGPNNTGKSYAATLAYAMTKALTDSFGSFQPETGQMNLFGQRFKASLTEPLEYSFLDLSESNRSKFYPSLARLKDQIVFRTRSMLQLYFSVEDLSNLMRSSESIHSGFQISSSNSGSLIEVSCIDDEFDLTSSFDLESINFFFNIAPYFLEEIDEILAESISENVWQAILNSHGLDYPRCYCLPPARSGIITGWPLLASLAIDVVRRQFGRRNLTLPTLPGTAGDFLQNVIQMISPPVTQTRDLTSSLIDALNYLRHNLLNGEIFLPEQREGQMDLEYVSKGNWLPVQRSSSMVGEVAPLDIFIRRLLQSGDLLVIDEPEAHLHPENQRHMARVLVRLATAGVTVIAPTHSSTIIHQISNLVRASELTEAERAELGLEESDRIGPGDVGVYAFKLGDDGTVIEEVEYDPEFGYPEEVFLDVAEQLTRESYLIDTKQSPVPA